jgi:hypothetical protein
MFKKELCCSRIGLVSKISPNLDDLATAKILIYSKSVSVVDLHASFRREENRKPGGPLMRD